MYATDSAIEIVTTDNLAQLVSIEKRIDAHEGEAVVDRWEFGRLLLEERIANGGKQLPHGRMETICVATGMEQTEIRNRMQFAEENDTEEKVTSILVTLKSWTAIVDKMGKRNPAAANNSGDNEWYTPAVFIDSAIRVMGAIDLDPASSASANVTVGAAVFYTKDDSGLDKPWAGRVWMNPPYASPLITQFTEKLVTEYVTDNVSEACVLVNNATETGWFINMAKVANAFCFPDSRVKFWKPDGTIAAPLQGQGVLYFGENGDKFVDTFRTVGFCLVKP